MAQRAVGSINLTFGLVHIPVKLYLSAKSENVSFKQMTKEGNPVKQTLVDSVTGEPADRNELLKGYEYSKNNYVLFTKDEVDALSSEKCNTTNIEEFVPYYDIDPIHIEKTYYVSPDKGADKAYLMLSQALEKTQKVAVAKWYAKGREHLVVISPKGDGIVMHQMYYPNEVRSWDLNCRNVHVSENELDLASQMIEQNSTTSYGNVDNDKNKTELYRDGFVDRVNDAIQSKMAGEKVHAPTSFAQATNGDLLDMLKASLKDKPASNKSAKKGSKKRKKAS